MLNDIDSIIELNTQVLLFDGNDSLSVFEIPLNPDAGTSSFLFRDQGISDSLEISYQTMANIISDECGVELIFYNMGPINTTFDSVRIIETQFFTELNSENIEIFR